MTIEFLVTSIHFMKNKKDIYIHSVLYTFINGKTGNVVSLEIGSSGVRRKSTRVRIRERKWRVNGKY